MYTGSKSLTRSMAALTTTAPISSGRILCNVPRGAFPTGVRTLLIM